MYLLQFSLINDSRTFCITNPQEAVRLFNDYRSYVTGSTLMTRGDYACEVEGGRRLERKVVIFCEIDKFNFEIQRYPL